MKKGKLIKLQLDYKTIIYVKTKQAIEVWKEKYPNLKILAA